ncbi:MAG: hypothetical protein MUE74_06015 [Bacteroidales bacterium]|jgi:hypothetical protein|nr:hypothetical protein [Bacteroidales bacterium]
MTTAFRELNLGILRKMLTTAALTLTMFLTTYTSDASEVKRLFTTDEMLRLELRSDFSAIQKDRDENPENHNGELIWYNEADDTIKLSVKLMVRGAFRLKPENCSFPPLHVNFKKNEVTNTPFEGQNKLKLVTPCQGEEDIIDEYLVYKLYNEVTELSFRVRLVRILYYDTSQDKPLFEKYSFFIEDKDDVAARNNLIARVKLATPFDINPDNYIKLSLFQYLIGNRDWFVSSRKNIELLQTGEDMGEIYAVPYDFDFSALVNAAYSKPLGASGEAVASRRYYKGICFTEEQFKEAFEFFGQMKPVFMSIINSQELLSKSNRRHILNYMNEFYAIIKSRYLFKENILSVCETRKDYNLPDE